jgi:hypothetical protein
MDGDDENAPTFSLALELTNEKLHGHEVEPQHCESRRVHLSSSKQRGNISLT